MTRFNTATSLEAGQCIAIGKPGSEAYEIYRIVRITDLGLVLWNGSQTYPAREFAFEDLIAEFNKDGLTADILDNKLGNINEFLATMQSISTRKDEWKNLEITNDKDGNQIFDFIDRRYDKEKSKKHYFTGNNGSIVEIISIQDGQATIRIGEEFTEKNEKTGLPSAKWHMVTDYPLQYLAYYLTRFSCAPRDKPPREIESKEMPAAAKTTKGALRAAFGRLSIHDLMSGSKKFIEEFKHHLQHGNHLQEQRVMLGIAKKIGMNNWNSEWYADFKSQYENGEKKLIEERLETLGKMGTPDRQKSIRASLLNNGTHDYDHWTNALSMIEKHGNLYAGGLADLEGTWIFFKRIAGIPLNVDVNQSTEFQRITTSIRGKGIDNVTEEAVIEEYMKTYGDFPNSQIWRMVKKRVKEGNDGELEYGGKEVEQFITLEQRIDYALGKFKSREYAHGIGALEKVFDKEGPAHRKQSLAFMLAMSRIPERLPRPLLDKFIAIYDAGRLHSPALTFIKDRQSQERFRDTVETLVTIRAGLPPSDPRHHPKIKAEFDIMMASIKKNTDVLDEKTMKERPTAPLELKNDSFLKVKSFWEKYGRELQQELTLSTKGSLMLSKSVVEAHPQLAYYKNDLKRQLGDTTLMHSTELDRGTPFMEGESAAGVISLKPDKIIDKMGLQLHH